MKSPIPRLLAFTLIASLGSGVSASDINKGRGIYQRHCISCHGSDGRGSMAGVPDFKRGQGLRRSDETLSKRIEAGKNACPAYRGILSEQDIFDVIAYIRTLN